MDPLSPLITALHSEGRLRVWSMVITVFGDMVQQRGGKISTTRLGAILGRVGVEQGALRTALSRLGRDGWVLSDRIGRTSHYRLSAQGLARFAPATTRIYAAPRNEPVSRWAISLRLGQSGRPEASLSPAEDVDGTVDCLVVGALQQISDSYRASLLSDEHREALAALALDIAVLSEISMPTLLDAAAARVLLIHRWRRIVLRFPEIPFELMPDNAPLADPRRAVADVYRQLSSASEAWLDSEFASLPPLAVVTEPLPQRFGEALQG